MASGGEGDISNKVIKNTQMQTLKSLWHARKACKSAVTRKENLSSGKRAKSGNRLATEGATDNIRPASKDAAVVLLLQHQLPGGTTDDIRPSSKGVTHIPIIPFMEDSLTQAVTALNFECA